MSVEELRVRLAPALSGELPGVRCVPHQDAVVLVADTSQDAAWARADQDVLCATERQRAARFVVPGLGETWAAAHVLLRHVLGLATNQPAAQVEFQLGPHGKPATAGVEFSLSHTATVVLIGICDTALGVDVEQLPRPDSATQLAHVFHPRETAELLALPQSLSREAFARLWVRKEALLKALGYGLTRELSADYIGTGDKPASPVAGCLIYDLPLPQLSGYRAALGLHVSGRDETESGA